MSNKTATAAKFSNALPTAYIIGGAGFVGSYVAEILRAQNVNVIALDDLSSGKELNTEKLKKDPNYTLIKTNINNGFSDEWPKADYIFHIGGIEAYVNGVDLTLNTMLVNSIGTYHSLEFAKKHKSRYLLVSSLDIYNGALSSIDLNKYFGLSTRDAKRYTHHEAKRYAEALVTEYYQKFELDARIVRISESFGPRMDIHAGTELAQLFSDAITSDTLTIKGDGLKILHPTYVTDITSGIVKAMFSPNTTGKIYNLANKDEINILNFAYSIQKNCTKPLKIQFTQEYKEIKFPMHKVELTQSQTDLAWSAKTSIDEGITQTLEYFFMFKDKIESEAPTVEIPIQEKSNEVPYVPTHIPPKENTGSQEKLAAVKEEKKKKLTRKTGKLNKANIAILSTSFFVILLMFVFPITTLYITSGRAFNIALEAANMKGQDVQKVNEKFLEAQRNISVATAQFDTLEWFFSMLRQRERFEGSRSSLQVVDKFSRSYMLGINTKNEANKIDSEIINGIAKPEQIDENNRRFNETMLTFENTVLESQALKSTIYTEKENNQITSIVTLTKDTLGSLRQHVVILQNTRRFIAPDKNKYYAVVFLDNMFLNPEGGKIYGYNLIETGPSGISQVKSYPYSDSNSYSDLVMKIKETAEAEKFPAIEAVLLVTDDVRKSLISTLKSVPNEKHAEVLNAENYQQKLMNKELTTQYKLDVWSAIWSSIQDTRELSSIGLTLQESIIGEHIQILMLNAGEILYPVCNEPNVLKQSFTSIENTVTATTPYCLKPQIQSETQGANLEWEVKTTADPDTLKASTTYTLTNKDKISRTIATILTVPGSPKLTNLLAPFPVSFDKIKTITTNNKTTWEYQAEIGPNSKTEVTYEWTSNISDGNLENNGVYIEKQFGALVKSITAEIKTGDKTITKQTENRDLFLPPATP